MVECESLSFSVAHYIFCTRNSLSSDILKANRRKGKMKVQLKKIYRLHTILHNIDEELFHNSLIQYIKLLMKN